MNVSFSYFIGWFGSGLCFKRVLTRMMSNKKFPEPPPEPPPDLSPPKPKCKNLGKEKKI